MPNLPNWLDTILLALLLGILANWLTPLPKIILTFITGRLSSGLVRLSKGFTRRRIRLLEERLERLKSYQRSFKVMQLAMFKRLLIITFYGFSAVVMTGIFIVATISTPESGRSDSGFLLSLSAMTIVIYTRFAILIFKASDDLRDLLNYDAYKKDQSEEIQDLERRLTQ
jgi:flagellar biosynthesis protein FlhB